MKLKPVVTHLQSFSALSNGYVQLIWVWLLHWIFCVINFMVGQYQIYASTWLLFWPVPNSNYSQNAWSAPPKRRLILPSRSLGWPITMKDSVYLACSWSLTYIINIEYWILLCYSFHFEPLECKLACPRYEHNTVILDGRTWPSLQNVSVTSVIFIASSLFSLLCEFFESDSNSVWVQKYMLFLTHFGKLFSRTRWKQTNS